MTEAYPLQWPIGKPRTKYPERSRFQVGSMTARDELFKELSMLGGKNIVVSTDIKLRLDGLPYASQKDPDDRGVAVYFTYKDTQVCFSCDRWDLIKDNMQAIRHTISALRGIARWGTGDMVEAAFKGFQALPPPITKEWYEILDISESSTFEKVKQSFKNKYQNASNDEERIQLNNAYQTAKGAF